MDRSGGDGRHLAVPKEPDQRLEPLAVLVLVAFDVLQLCDRVDQNPLGVGLLDYLFDVLGEPLGLDLG